MKHITYVFLIPARLSLTFAPSESNALESMQPFIIERGSVSINTILVFHTLLQWIDLREQVLSEHTQLSCISCMYSCHQWRQLKSCLVRIHDTKGTHLIHPDPKAGV